MKKLIAILLLTSVFSIGAFADEMGPMQYSGSYISFAVGGVSNIHVNEDFFGFKASAKGDNTLTGEIGLGYIFPRNFWQQAHFSLGLNALILHGDSISGVAPMIDLGVTKYLTPRFNLNLHWSTLIFINQINAGIGYQIAPGTNIFLRGGIFTGSGYYASFSAGTASVGIQFLF